MKSKAILVSIIALFALTLVLTVVSAAEIAVSVDEVEVNDVIMTSDPLAGTVSETVPVVVRFTANEEADDVRVKVYIEGYKDEISDTTERFHVLEGRRYVERFSLTLPSTMDIDDLNEDLNILVRISAKGKDSFEESYPMTIQRDSYGLNILSVDMADSAVAGNVVPIDVVLQNNGNDRLDNVYIKVSIPDLSVSRRVYLGDLEAVEDDYDTSIDDATSKRIYLDLPRSTIPGVYVIEVEAYNYDVSTSVEGKLVVKGAETSILPTVTSKTIGIGQETTFDVVIANPSDRMVVYSLTPEEAKGLTVTIEEPVVAIPAGSSKTVKVLVKATKSAEEGTHLITINVNSESGVEKQISLSANVEQNGVVAVGGEANRSNTVVVLTIVLAIIFVVLLIILIVLLTKKPAESEEFGETSYY